MFDSGDVFWGEGESLCFECVLDEESELGLDRWGFGLYHSKGSRLCHGLVMRVLWECTSELTGDRVPKLLSEVLSVVLS